MEQKSAEHSEAKKKQVAEERVDLMHGKNTCVVKQTQSITVQICLLLKELNLTYDVKKSTP